MKRKRFEDGRKRVAFWHWFNDSSTTLLLLTTEMEVSILANSLIVVSGWRGFGPPTSTV